MEEFLEYYERNKRSLVKKFWISKAISQINEEIVSNAGGINNNFLESKVRKPAKSQKKKRK